MKRKFIAVMLSLSMCMAPVCEAGAADFCAPEEGDSAVGSEAGSFDAVADTGETEDSAAETDAGSEVSDPENTSAFSDGETDSTDENSSVQEVEDPFSSGEDGSAQEQTAVTALPDATGTVKATSEDWVKVGSRFKLKKATVPAVTPTPTPDVTPTSAPENPVPDNPEAGQPAENSEDQAEELANVELTEGTDVQTTAAEGQTAVETVADTLTDTQDAEAFQSQDEEIPVLDEEQAAQGQTGEYIDTYYTSADGIVKVTTTYKGKKHTGYYYFDENGYMMTGRVSIPVTPDTASYAAEIDTEAVAAASVNEEVADTQEVTADSSDMEAAQTDFSASEAAALSDGDAENMQTDAQEAVAEIVPEEADSENAEAAQDDVQTVQYYFTTSGEASKTKYTGCESEAVTPYTSPMGQQLRNKWLWTKEIFEYYGADGAYMTVAQLNETYKSENKYTGYFKIGTDYYCLDSTGKPRVGNVKITVDGVSNRYYFQPAVKNGIPGKMFHDGWRKYDSEKGERWLYYNKGIDHPEDIGKYYQRGVVATKIDKKGTDTYLLDKYGYLVRSKIKKAANGAYYGSNKKGVVYKNAMVKYSTGRYYFTKSGKRASWTNSWHKVKTHYYFFGNVPGKVSERHGWQRLARMNGQFIGWFYFDVNGNNYTNKMVTLDGGKYYFTKTGRLASGIWEVKGKKYLFEVSSDTVRNGRAYQNTMVFYKGSWYVANADGSLVKDEWRNINGNWYCVENYRVVTNAFRRLNGVNGYLDASGKYTQSGWVVESESANLVKCIDPDGNGSASTGFVTNASRWIDGKLYYFDSNGYRMTDVSSRYSGPYYLEVDRINGVMTVYTSSDKTIPVKTIRVSVGLPGTPTWTGTYRLSRSARWQPLMGPSWGQYGTHVDGCGLGGIFIHSVACSTASSFALPAGEYNKLGNPASHGCIRTCVADAKWVYENCHGSIIHIFDGTYQASEVNKGPLGRKPLVPLQGAGNYDPTDPAV